MAIGTIVAKIALQCNTWGLPKVSSKCRWFANPLLDSTKVSAQNQITMRNRAFLFSLLLTFTTVAVSANGESESSPAGPIKAGIVEFEVDATGLEPSLAPLVQNMTLVAYFDPSHYRAEMNTGGMGTTVAIANANNESMTLIDMMGMRLAVRELSVEETEVSVKYPGGTKEIAGYTCKRAVVTTAMGDVNLYVTDQIKAPKVNTQIPLYALEGFPLQMELNNGPMSISFVATKVTATTVDKSKFELVVPDGYDEKTPAELERLFGGLGF